MEDLLIGLNENQQKAVTSTEGYIRVIAGAGSGKTKTLVNRFVYLVETLGISPSNILCVTFTNKAASEMRKRVKTLLGNDTDSSMICTYHGFCVKVLREDIHHINYPKNFMILDVDDQKDILKEVYEELGLTIRFMKFDDVLKKISIFKSNPDYVELLTNPSIYINVDAEMDTVEQIIQLYLKKQRKYFALDFQDLINFVFYLFKQNNVVELKWQNRLHYIQVDEFQDSSKNQISLLKIISEVHKNLFVVGDPDQAIYAWRGAKPEYLVDFDKYHNPCVTIILNENYRSTPEILNLGNSIIKNNKIRVDKDLYTQNHSGIEAIHFHGKSEFDEVKYITETIISYVESENAKYSDFAILYRANFNSRFIEQGFMRQNIPYTMYSGFKFFQRTEIKDCLAYLKMLAFSDDLSLIRTINNPKRKFGKTKIDFLKEKAKSENLSLYDALLKYKDCEIFTKTKVHEYINVIEKYKKIYSTLSISEILRALLDESGYDEELRLNGDQMRIDNVSELLSSIISSEKEQGEYLELDNYLQHISLYSDTEREDRKESVKLMTIHTAKGLEFPYVFLVSFNDGSLPNYRALETGDKKVIEEERRLAYVAITRAMQAFFMTESEGLTNYGRKKIPSRFIFEIKQNLFTRVGTIEQDLLDEATEIYEAISLPTESKATDEFSVGDLVKHLIFGNGVIKEINNSANQYLVFFEDKALLKPIKQGFKGLTRKVD